MPYSKPTDPFSLWKRMTSDASKEWSTRSSSQTSDPSTKRITVAQQLPMTSFGKLTQDYLNRGLIRKSCSPYNFPVTVVRKANGKPRLCINFKKLNAITVDDKYPLPNMKDIVKRLRNARFYTALDIAWCFWHIKLDPRSVSRTAFSTVDGHYEWLVMEFGLKNAPATCQRVLRQVLSDTVFQFVLHYLDDIIIYSRSFEEHVTHVSRVMDLMSRNNIRLRLEKCKFAVTEIKFLGLIFQYNTVRANPDKLVAVKNYPLPERVVDLQRFLGLANWFRDFIVQFATVAHPLYQAARGPRTATIVWSATAEEAFRNLKAALVSPPVLTIYEAYSPCGDSFRRQRRGNWRRPPPAGRESRAARRGILLAEAHPCAAKLACN